MDIQAVVIVFGIYSLLLEQQRLNGERREWQQKEELMFVVYAYKYSLHCHQLIVQMMSKQYLLSYDVMATPHGGG